MIKKVIFFTSCPLNLRDYNRFGADVIKKNGFEVIFFDFSDYMFPSLRKRIIITPIDCSDHHRYAKEGDAIHAILNLSKDCFVVSLMPYSYKSFKIYKALSKKKIPYAITVAEAIPIPMHNLGANASQDAIASNAVNLFIRLSRLTLPKLHRFIINYLFQPRFYKYWRIRAARLCIGGGVNSIDPCHTKRLYPFSKDTEILWAHALDYDVYLEKNTGKNIDVKNKAVFLDVGAPQFFCDAGLVGREEIRTKEKYYPSLCKFFDRVERELGVKVVIAGHPRAKHDTYPEYFGKRLTLHGKTCQMVKDSKFVITHGSTAVSFAVLFKKPIIFITTNESENSVYGDKYDIEAMASFFGKKAINIDTEFLLDWDRELLVDEAIYANYKNRYIKKTDTEDSNSWQIFANRLKHL